MTNDPWLCAGHLPDTAIVSPIFHQGRFVGFAGSIANVSDIGGTLDQKSVRESYEEGIFFPICKLYDEYEANELIFDLFRWNVRAPEMVLTDIEAQVAANEVGARRVLDFLDEYGLEDLAALSTAIRGRSEAAMRRAISALPDGTYTNEVQTDGLMEPLSIAVKITVDGDEMIVDYEGFVATGGSGRPELYAHLHNRPHDLPHGLPANARRARQRGVLRSHQCPGPRRIDPQLQLPSVGRCADQHRLVHPRRHLWRAGRCCP